MKNIKSMISIDAMGADLGPKEVVFGIRQCASSYPNIKFLVHGNGSELSKLIKDSNLKIIPDMRHLIEPPVFIQFKDDLLNHLTS